LENLSSMRRGIFLLFFFFAGATSWSQQLNGEPLVATYSIVAYDEATGQMGVAVQSHWFSVGSIVIWAEAGTGAIATQSLSNPQFGPDGLKLLKEGNDAQATLNALIAGDEGRDVRQVGVVDANGNAVSYTGAKCIANAGDHQGKGYAVQANLMLNDTIWPAMAAAYEANMDLPLAERMVKALDAAQEAGGDSRGRQSAALLVVNNTNSGIVMEDKLIDLKVEDHPNPVKELGRLLNIHRAYEHLNHADVLLEEGKFSEAVAQYEAAEKLYPENEEIQFWQAVSLASSGNLKEALPLFKYTFSKNKNWRKVVGDIHVAGFLTVSEKDLETILSLQ